MFQPSRKGWESTEIDGLVYGDNLQETMDLAANHRGFCKKVSFNPSWEEIMFHNWLVVLSIEALSTVYVETVSIILPDEGTIRMFETSNQRANLNYPACFLASIVYPHSWQKKCRE